MVHSYAVRITYAYDAIKPLLECWAERCEKMAVYEHVGERTNKVHIHLVMENCEIGKEQLKNMAKPTPITLIGNKLCSFKKYDGNEKAYVYMTKGVLTPKFLKVWTDVDADRWKKLWVGDLGHQNSKDVLLYEDCYDELTFEVAWKYYQRDHPNNYIAGSKPTSSNDYQFNFIKQWARNYSFSKFNRIWNIQAINMYKMLVYTYVYRNNLVIPEKESAFKSF